MDDTGQARANAVEIKNFPQGVAPQLLLEPYFVRLVTSCRVELRVIDPARVRHGIVVLPRSRQIYTLGQNGYGIKRETQW